MPKYIFRLAMIAKAEEAIGRSELAITRQLLVIETLTANGQTPAVPESCGASQRSILPNCMSDGSIC